MSIEGNGEGILQHENIHPFTLTFEEFTKSDIETLPNGTIIEGVDPSEIFASQRWVDIQKVARTMRHIERGQNLVLPVYACNIPDKRRRKNQEETGDRRRNILILRNGHTHALEAMERKEKITIVITGINDKNTDFIALTSLRKKYGSRISELLRY